MDVAAASPSVARSCLLREMRAMAIDKNLVQWVDDFMQGGGVVMSVGGQGGEARGVTAGLPQGSPVSPVLFAIYIADIHGGVEGQMEGCRGTSFVDDVTWAVEGENMLDLAAKLEGCAEKSLRWAQNNAARFETSKTEAILFSRNRRQWREKGRWPIRVGDQQVFFAKEATRWLGVWIDSAITFVDNRRRCISQARQAGARVRRLANKHGIPLTSARNLQTSIIQGTMLYAAELTWRGEKKMESDDCDGEVLEVPGRPSARADPGWTVGGVAVAAGSDPGWVEDCGCAVPDSAQDVACRASDGGKQRLYTWSVCAPRTTATHATANQD